MLPGDRQRYREELRAKCEAMGLDEVREMLARGAYGGRKRPVIQEWVDEQLALERSQSEAGERDVDRGIARRANSISLWTGIVANIIALSALAVAIYAAYK